MAFVVRALFLTVIVCGAKAGYLSGHHNHDSYTDSANSAPSASYGPPSGSYGTPSDSYGAPALSGSSSLGSSLGSGYDSGHGSGLGRYSEPAPIEGGLLAGDVAPAPLTPLSSGALGPYPAAVPAPVYGPPAVEGSLNLGSNLAPANTGSAILDTARPLPATTRYELQSVIQNVVRRVPVEVVRHVNVRVPQPYPVHVRQEVKVNVPQPYPVHVDVVKHVPYPVYKTQHVEVEKRVPVPVIKQVPVEVIKKVHIPVDKPYEVIKKVHVPVVKHVEVPHVVWKAHPIHIIKHVTHYKKKSCCW